MSTSSSSYSKLNLKVVMNKEKSKVLFAEADSDVVDVLLSFLTLPLAKIIGILEKRCVRKFSMFWKLLNYGDDTPCFGSLTTLYSGLSNLDSTHFSVGGAKQMLLNPTTTFQRECRRLKLDISDSQPVKVYYCEDLNCSKSLFSNVSLYSETAKCACGKPLNREDLVKECQFDNGGVFMMKEASFIICDDLRIVPIGTKFLHTLNDLGIADIQDAEIIILSIDVDDVVHLLVYSLFSSTPLTDFIIKKTQKIFPAGKPCSVVHLLVYSLFSLTPLTDFMIKKTQKISPVAKPYPASFSHRIRNGNANSRNMVLSVHLLKSTNKFLLAVATDEFVEFLFSFLVVPLGGVEYLLGGKTCLKNIDNLCKSVKDMIDDKYFKTPNTKSSLMNPKLPYGYTWRNQFLPLTEGSAPKLNIMGEPLSFKSSEGKGSFVKEKTMYIVSDDLMVTPFSMTSTVSIINSFGVSLSDVKEIDFQIGTVEALDILLASLSSTTVLTDALVNPMLNSLAKRPKKEPCN